MILSYPKPSQAATSALLGLYFLFFACFSLTAAYTHASLFGECGSEDHCPSAYGGDREWVAEETPDHAHGEFCSFCSLQSSHKVHAGAKSPSWILRAGTLRVVPAPEESAPASAPEFDHLSRGPPAGLSS